MERREFLNALTVSAIATLVAPRIAFASTGDQISSAMSAINKALPYGEEPAHSSSFVQHIDNAIDHAMMAERAHANSHVKTAIRYLRRARKIAYGTHMLKYSRKGAALAKKALAQLQSAE